MEGVSRPLRARELKRLAVRRDVLQGVSRPLRARELKLSDWLLNP